MPINLKKLSLRRRHKYLAYFILVVVLFYFLGNFLYAQIFKVVPDSAYYVFPSIGFNADVHKVLVFSPHPDDETLAAGGYIQAALARGIEVRVVLITDGNFRGQGAKRQVEFKQATTELGLQNSGLVFLEYKDGYLKTADQNKLEADLKKQIDDFKPQVVIYPSRFDGHPDHKTAGVIVEKILQNNQDIEKYAYLVHYHGYPYPRKLATNRFLMPPSKLFFSCQWFKFVLIPDQEQKKLGALDNYKISLSYPIEGGYLSSFVRQNELFCQE
jgi:LmbE family N-acetylglucosaminyl deacetylase